jgi:hypothetical protein
MSLSELEQHVFAYYVSGHAKELNIATRWYPYGELVLVIADKVTVAVRKFGRKPRACAKAVATAFLDHMIEKGAWDTKQNEFGGQMHQFQADRFKAELRNIQAGDPIIGKASAEGPEFWEKAFADLTEQPAG